MSACVAPGCRNPPRCAARRQAPEPWNYDRTPERFARWIESVAAETALLDVAEVARWNMHERYLLELSERRVAVLPSFADGVIARSK